MQRIISLLAALMILSFSVIGEESHASVPVCTGFSIAQLDLSGANPPIASGDLRENASESTDAAPVPHDCHFGHCAFIPHLSATASSSAPFTDAETAKLYPYTQSGFRSETLRPPSLV